MAAGISCLACGAKLEAPDQVCPECGSRDRNIVSQERGEGHESLKLKAEDRSGFVQRKLTVRSKRAAKSGQRAEERIEIDRTSEKETKKLHEVWEQNKEGEWEKVHSHEDVAPAKRRKKVSSDK